MKPRSKLRLTIQGKQPAHRLQLLLVEGRDVRVGRAPRNGVSIPWDLAISREHADLCWNEGLLRVTCLPTAQNPLVYRSAASEEAVLRPGESFVVGSTVFEATEEIQNKPISNNSSFIDPDYPRPPDSERSFSAADLRKVAFQNSDHQLELLSKLPELIAGARTDEELQQTVCGLLMNAIPEATAVAVTHYDVSLLPQSEDTIDNFPSPLTMRVQTRFDFEAHFRPSRRIVLRTLMENASFLHIWKQEETDATATITEGLGWAFCAPIRDPSSHGWCLYVSGKGAQDGGLYVSQKTLSPQLRFTELVAQFIGSVRHVRLLQEQQTRLSSFFSPKVIDSLTATGSDTSLAPAERDITVLFCDVRGFSRKAEKLRKRLLELLQTVSVALGVMVEGIINNDGAIADFQGDAALGFWGWPVEEPRGPIRACAAAFEILKQFGPAAEKMFPQLQGFSVGIGIAHGRAVAGQIGTTQQAKIGVFGPVVNVGARLEAMTRHFGIPVCFDGASAAIAKKQLSGTDGRIQFLASVRPQGMTDTVDVHGLLPSLHDDTTITEETLQRYADVIRHVTDGAWSEALQLLRTLPDFGPASFLTKQLRRHNNTVPADWDGVFTLHQK